MKSGMDFAFEGAVSRVYVNVAILGQNINKATIGCNGHINGRGIHLKCLDNIPLNGSKTQ